MPVIKDKLRKNLPAVASSYHLLWAWNAAKLRRHPSKKIFVIGITGTKGKTTTVELLNAILEAAGKKTAILSSLRIKIAGENHKNPTGNSMPGRGRIQGFLYEAVRAKCGYAIIEVTSQGVVQHRHRFIDWNIGAITNIHPEHIESHGSFEKYRGAKLDFLKYVLQKGGKVFLNQEDAHYPFFAGAIGDVKTILFSRGERWVENYLPRESIVRSMVDPSTGNATPKFLWSDFNQSNAACAVAIAKEIGIGDEVIKKALGEFDGVPGRMQFVRAGGYTAVADYAHTPDSLEAAYKSLRMEFVDPKTNNRLICVLGACGGGRDTWKRPEFGRIAAQYCDEIILTEEDPYDENPADIIAQIKSGIPEAQRSSFHIYEVPSRREAITKAVQMARHSDIVIGTGKGSEDWIHYSRGKKVPWNEKQEFENALETKVNEHEEDSDIKLPWIE
jgi:UDP-N-acetylmuramoyl-L-alanyl-D-glutamate--2,6-diaminopimelate ligase